MSNVRYDDADNETMLNIMVIMMRMMIVEVAMNLMTMMMTTHLSPGRDKGRRVALLVHL